MNAKTPARTDKVVRTEEEWRRLLTPMQFNILRREGTEPAFHNKYWDNHEDGTYVCAGAGCRCSHRRTSPIRHWLAELHSAIADDAVGTELTPFGMRRTSVLCA